MDERQTRELVERHIRAVPDFPTAGILFRDITPLLAAPAAFNAAVDWFASRADGADAIVGIESRGFLFGAPAAAKLGLPFVPARKAGKLPLPVYGREYALEYGTAQLEIHRDALEPGCRVLLIDDVLATGGSIEAAANLIADARARLSAIAVLIELADLNGRTRAPVPLHSLIAC